MTEENNKALAPAPMAMKVYSAPSQQRRAVPAPIEYHEFPKWLDHQSLSPVIVHDRDQEESFTAKGYFSRQAPGAAENYLVAKATEKIDDAIRTMNKKVEEIIASGLRQLSVNITGIIRREIEWAKEQDEYGLDSGAPFESDIAEEFSNATQKITSDAMTALRDIAKSTNAQ